MDDFFCNVITDVKEPHPLPGKGFFIIIYTDHLPSFLRGRGVPGGSFWWIVFWCGGDYYFFPLPFLPFPLRPSERRVLFVRVEWAMVILGTPHPAEIFYHTFTCRNPVEGGGYTLLPIIIIITSYLYRVSGLWQRDVVPWFFFSFCGRRGEGEGKKFSRINLTCRSSEIMRVGSEGKIGSRQSKKKRILKWSREFRSPPLVTFVNTIWPEVVNYKDYKHRDKKIDKIVNLWKENITH